MSGFEIETADLQTDGLPGERFAPLQEQVIGTNGRGHVGKGENKG